jgi:hypothetical protein
MVLVAEAIDEARPLVAKEVPICAKSGSFNRSSVAAIAPYRVTKRVSDQTAILAARPKPLESCEAVRDYDLSCFTCVRITCRMSGMLSGFALGLICFQVRQDGLKTNSANVHTYHILQNSMETTMECNTNAR